MECRAGMNGEKGRKRYPEKGATEEGLQSETFSGMLTIGEVKLMNQFGRKGVIRKKMM